MKILVVEDERDMNLLICKTLKKNGYSVDSCLDGEEAMDYLLGTGYDCVLLDVMLPKKDGHQVLREMRQKGITAPVLFLTARDSIADRVTGLDLGADDYLVKPFDFQELLARIRVLTRKQVGSTSNRYTLEDLTLDVETHQVFRGGQEIILLPKEFSALECLIRNKGTVVTRRQMEDTIWNYEDAPSSNNLDVYISKLRKKIDEGYDIKLLHTIRGVGWVLRGEKEGKP